MIFTGNWLSVEKGRTGTEGLASRIEDTLKVLTHM